MWLVGLWPGAIEKLRALMCGEFAIDADGEFHFANRRCGVMFRGAWLSNTYAWTAPPVMRVHPDKPRVVISEFAPPESLSAKAKSVKAKKTRSPRKNNPKRPSSVRVWTLAEWNAAHPKPFEFE